MQVTESPILFRDEGMRTACSPDGLCSDGCGLELKCPFTSRDFMKFRLGGFEAIKSAYMPSAIQYVGNRRMLGTANYDPRMKREGIHHVVVERDDKYMSDFNEMVPEFISKMDESLAEIGVHLRGAVEMKRTPFYRRPEKQGNSPASRASDLDDPDARPPCYRQRNSGRSSATLVEFNRVANGITKGEGRIAQLIASETRSTRTASAIAPLT